MIALRLAAMHDADRRWLMRQLPAFQRRKLQQLLDELLQLSAREPSLLAEAIRDAGEPKQNGLPEAAASLPPKLAEALTRARARAFDDHVAHAPMISPEIVE